MDLTAWQSQLRKGAAELVVLVVLAEREAYGLEILHAANAQGPLLTEGGLYPLLNRLEQSGRIAARWVLPDSGGNPRKYYALTDQGRQLAAAMRGRWVEFRTTIARLVEE